MKRRIVQPKNCFALGLAGAACSLAAGVMMAILVSPAVFFRFTAMAFTGIMLLFLATTEKGDDKRSRRIKLLLLFVALLISYLDLPLLCPPLEALVLPLLGIMYREKGNRTDLSAILLLSVLELAYAVIRTLALTPLLGPSPLPYQIMGITLALVAVARGWLLFRLYRAAAKQPDTPAGTPSSL